MAAASFDLGEFFLRIDRVRSESGQSWASLSRQTGVAVSTIRRFATAPDAEADGVLTLLRWLDAVPEEFVVGGEVVGERLGLAHDGFVRVDMSRVAAVTGERRVTGRTTVQRLVEVAQASGRSIASFTQASPARSAASHRTTSMN